jgi:hypothetical protein
VNLAILPHDMEQNLVSLTLPLSHSSHLYTLPLSKAWDPRKELSQLHSVGRHKPVPTLNVPYWWLIPSHVPMLKLKELQREQYHAPSFAPKPDQFTQDMGL